MLFKYWSRSDPSIFRVLLKVLQNVPPIRLSQVPDRFSVHLMAGLANKLCELLPVHLLLLL